MFYNGLKLVVKSLRPEKMAIVRYNEKNTKVLKHRKIKLGLGENLFNVFSSNTKRI